MGSAIEILIIAFLFWVFKPYIWFVVLLKLWTHKPVVGMMNRSTEHRAIRGIYTA